MSFPGRDRKIKLDKACQFLDPFQLQVTEIRHRIVSLWMEATCWGRGFCDVLVPTNSTTQEAGERKWRYFKVTWHVKKTESKRIAAADRRLGLLTKYPGCSNQSEVTRHRPYKRKVRDSFQLSYVCMLNLRYRQQSATRQAMCVQSNNQALSRNHCCCGKAINITYWSLCACVHVSKGARRRVCAHTGI